jgi:polar amino acid transport system substrate-binding protein
MALLAACGGDDDDGGGGSTEAASTDQGNFCQKGNPPGLKNAGQLTVGTDKPAFPPYFVDDDPTNGKGFESAVAYAVADALGFTRDQVEWTVVSFNAFYAPGPKDFDSTSTRSRSRRSARRRWTSRSPTTRRLRQW